MTPTQARQAVELLGGLCKTADLIANTVGNPLDRPSLLRILKRDKIPDWLADQLKQRVFEHHRECAVLLSEVA